MFDSEFEEVQEKINILMRKNLGKFVNVERLVIYSFLDDIECLYSLKGTKIKILNIENAQEFQMTEEHSAIIAEALISDSLEELNYSEIRFGIFSEFSEKIHRSAADNWRSFARDS